MKAGEVISNPVTVTVTRLLVGGLFVLAGLPKILDPGQFSEVIEVYMILPENLIPFVAVTLPWLELLCGTMLILNVFVQSNALVITGILVVFTLIVAHNLLNGMVHDCGCFSLPGGWFGSGDSISLTTVVRDLVLVLLAVPSLLYGSNVFFGRR